jgi:DNA transformation protein and related proteins
MAAMRRAEPPPSDITRLPGLGPASAALLARLGVHDAATLRARDAFELYAALQAIAPKTSLNMLYALIGAQEGVDWRIVARERRSALLTELDARRPPLTRTRP